MYFAAQRILLALYLTYVSASLEGQSDDCSIGKYLLVSRQHHYPNCELLLRLYSPWPVNSHEACFAKACELQGNVVHHRRNRHCFIYRCTQNAAGTDWDYKWRAQGEWGVVYAQPHPYTPRCFNSYFMRRTWNTRFQQRSNCFEQGRMRRVQDVQECMRFACYRKANVLDYFPTDRGCVVYHCRWNSRTGDYFFNFVSESQPVVTFSLSHMEQCNTTFPAIPIPSPIDYGNSCPMTGIFPAEYHQLPDVLCLSGSNSFVATSLDNAFRSYRCLSNNEGTEWGLYNQNICFTQYAMNNTQMYVLPFPGTPECRGSQFVIARLKQHCVMSTCNSIARSRVVDLRECMKDACDLGANVINYITNTSYDSASVCDMRVCNKRSEMSDEFNDDEYMDMYYLRLRAAYVNNRLGYDVYVLYYDTISSTPVYNTTTESITNLTTVEAANDTTTVEVTTAQLDTTTPPPTTVTTMPMETSIPTTEQTTVTENITKITEASTRSPEREELLRYQQENHQLKVVAIILGNLLFLSLVGIAVIFILHILRRRKQSEPNVKFENAPTAGVNVDPTEGHPTERESFRPKPPKKRARNFYKYDEESNATQGEIADLKEQNKLGRIFTRHDDDYDGDNDEKITSLHAKKTKERATSHMGPIPKSMHFAKNEGKLDPKGRLNRDNTTAPEDKTNGDRKGLYAYDNQLEEQDHFYGNQAMVPEDDELYSTIHDADWKTSENKDDGYTGLRMNQQDSIGQHSPTDNTKPAVSQKPQSLNVLKRMKPKPKTYPV